MSGPHVPLVPLVPLDMLDVSVDRQAELDEAWDAGYAAAVSDRKARVLGIVLATISGGILGAALLLAAQSVHAAPRSAQPVIPSGRSSAGPETDLAGQSGAPLPGDAPSPASGSEHGPSPAITEPDAVFSGIATWCAPTPTKCRSWGGDAHLAAVASFRYGDRPYQATVRYGGRWTIVTVVSFCACGSADIDLSPSAFDDLAPLWRGRIEVSIEPGAPGQTPPPTDVGP